MTPILFAAILSFVGVLVGASLQYFFGRTLELRKQLQTQKGQAYSDDCRIFAAIATTGRTKEVLGQLADAKTRVCIYGSTLVVQRLGEFERAAANTASPENRLLVTELVLAMRRDIGGRATPPAKDDLGIILFGAGWKS